MDGIKNFLCKYKGAILGLIIAIILIALKIYKIIISVIIIAFSMFIGNYIQYNKEYVKGKVKEFIDRF